MKIIKIFHRFIFILSIMVILCLTLIPATPSLALTGSISISPSSGTVGTSITVTGSGFTPSSAYTVKFGDTVVALGNVSTPGSFVTTYSIPLYPRGIYQIAVTTSGSDISNAVNFTVIPSINTDISLGRVGSQVNVSGDGFTPYSYIGIYFDNTNSGSVQTNSRGSFFAATITIPQTAEGEHSISSSDGIYAPTATFQVIPEIELSQAPELVGDNIRVTGTGYATTKTSKRNHYQTSSG